MFTNTIGCALMATLTATLLSLPALANTPCDGLDIQLPANQHTQWSANIAQHLYTSKVDLQQVWGVGPWRLVQAMSDQERPDFIIYPDSPGNGGYVMSWNGTSQRDQLARLEAQAIAGAPGIPAALAKCFAWAATAPR